MKANNSNIKVIYSSEYVSVSNIELNNCQIEDIRGNAIINNSDIKKINMRTGGTFIINSGTIGEIVLNEYSGNIDLTIGDKNAELNTNNPIINKITAELDLASIYTSIKFYNGLIKESFWDMSTGEFSYSNSEYKIRPNSTVKKTTEGYILN